VISCPQLNLKMALLDSHCLAPGSADPPLFIMKGLSGGGEPGSGGSGLSPLSVVWVSALLGLQVCRVALLDLVPEDTGVDGGVLFR
jgi:hypothetical protein